MHGINEVGQIKTHTAEPLVSEVTSFEVQIAVEYLYWYKPLGVTVYPTGR
jgi:hypothetical protein